MMEAVLAALRFIEATQMENGVWLTKVQPYNQVYQDVPEAELRQDIFTTAIVLREIACIQKQGTMLDKARQFLLAEQRDNGLWNFYPKRARRLLPADFDTNACVINALTLLGEQNIARTFLEQLDRYKHPDGGYWTFLIPANGSKEYPIVQNMHSSLIDTHILLCLNSLGIRNLELADYLSQLLKSQRYEQVFSYQNPLLFLMLLARAIQFYPEYRSTIMPILEEELLAQARVCELNSLNTAYLALGLLDCDAPSAADFVQELLAQQESNGAWPNHYFHSTPVHFYSSQAIVTAFASHALHQYSQRKP